MPADLAGARVAASVAQMWNGAAHTLAVGAILLACPAYRSRFGPLTLDALAPPLGAASPVVLHLGFSVTVSGSGADGLCS